LEAADAVVSLLEPQEVQELGLREEADLCREAGIEFIAFPLPDRGVPDSLSKTIKMAQALADQMQDGKSVIIHCRAGIGRSALLAACVLVRAGVQADKVFEMIAASRGLRVPDTDDQILWLHDFATVSRSSDASRQIDGT
jgi:protein-tyrosine phosphatase